jgi:uncharacterized membrane protein YphA (DoxX/SURF4 family)
MSYFSGSVGYPILGLGFAIAGADKLLALRGYRRLFRHWGWSRSAMRAVGAGELAGGIMLASPGARRLGAVVLTGVCAAVLTAELRRSETRHALPRGALLLAAALCALPRRAHG